MNADPRSQILLNQLGDVPTIPQRKLAVFVAPLEKLKFKKRRGRGGASYNDPNNLVKERVKKGLPDKNGEEEDDDEPNVQVDPKQKVTNWLDKLKQDTLLPPTTSLPKRHMTTPNKEKHGVPSADEKEAQEERKRLIAHHGGPVAYMNKVRSGEINVHTLVPEGDVARPMVVDSSPTNEPAKQKKGGKAVKKQSDSKPEPMEVDKKSKTQKKQSVTKPEPMEVDTTSKAHKKSEPVKDQVKAKKNVHEEVKELQQQQPSSLITRKSPENKRHTKEAITDGIRTKVISKGNASGTTLGKHTVSDMYGAPIHFKKTIVDPDPIKRGPKGPILKYMKKNSGERKVPTPPLHPRRWRY
ncbi:hypothetical protein BC832DRAFT_595908 [Gaertneriomyces semiglobifer]|nr:hypothetical protein BC832DRAFT_595908 [Gaertneriomyces semiglobifer]